MRECSIGMVVSFVPWRSNTGQETFWMPSVLSKCPYTKKLRQGKIESAKLEMDVYGATRNKQAGGLLDILSAAK